MIFTEPLPGWVRYDGAPLTAFWSPEPGPDADVLAPTGPLTPDVEVIAQWVTITADKAMILCRDIHGSPGHAVRLWVSPGMGKPPWEDHAFSLDTPNPLAAASDRASSSTPR